MRLPLRIGLASAVLVTAAACGSSPTEPSSSVQLAPTTQNVSKGGSTATFGITVKGQPYSGGADCSQTTGGSATAALGQVTFVSGAVAGLFQVTCQPTGVSDIGTAAVQVTQMTHMVYAPAGAPASGVLNSSVQITFGEFSDLGSMLAGVPVTLVQNGSGDSWSGDVFMLPGHNYWIYAEDMNRATQTVVDFGDGFTGDGISMTRTAVIGAPGKAARLNIDTNYVPH